MKSKIVSLLLGNRGASRLKTFLIIGIIAAVGYAGLKVGKPYYEWIQIKRTVKDLAEVCRNQTLSCVNNALPGRIEKITKEKFDKLGAEVVTKKTDKGKRTVIIMDYKVRVIFIPDKLEHDFKFHVEESNI